MSDTKLKDVLQAGIAQLDLDVTDSQSELMLDYVALLVKWNAAFNLTAIRDAELMVTHHLLDSLAVLPYVTGPRVADIGSGAGLPGIVLAIMRPQHELLLLDSNGKKTRFLTQVSHELALSNVEVFHGRIEDYPATPGFDTVVCRALASLPRLVELGGHLISAGGSLVAQKGLYPDEELDALPESWSASTVAIAVPFLSEKERHIVTLRRTSPDQ